MLRSLVLLALVVAPAASAHAAWQAPVRGPVAARFHYTRAHPYAAGQRRGVDLVAAAGDPVVAPCTGEVTFAGGVPGRASAGVALRCGALAATVLGLGELDVRRGRLVLGGARLGTAGAGGLVRLGARHAGDRHGYLDPLALLGPRDRPPAPAPWRVGPRPPSRARPLARPAHVRFAARRTARDRVPAVAWLGAVLLTVALGAGVLRRRHLASRDPCPSTSPRPSTT